MPLPSPGGICTIIDRGSGPMVLVAPGTCAPVSSNSSAREYDVSSGSVKVSVTDCGAVGQHGVRGRVAAFEKRVRRDGACRAARAAPRCRAAPGQTPRTLAPTLSRFMRRPSQAPRRRHHRMSLPEGSLGARRCLRLRLPRPCQGQRANNQPKDAGDDPDDAKRARRGGGGLASATAVWSCAGSGRGCGNSIADSGSTLLNVVRPRGDAFVDRRLADGAGDAKGIVPSRGRDKRGLVFALADRHQRQVHRLPIFADFSGEGCRQVVDRLRAAGGVLLHAAERARSVDRDRPARRGSRPP